MRKLLLFICIVCSNNVLCQIDSPKDSVLLENELEHLRNDVSSTPSLLLQFSLQKLQEHKDLKSAYFKAMIYHIIGEKYELNVQLDSAQRYLMMALELRYKGGYFSQAATTHEELAEVFFRLSEDSTALNHLYIALSIKKGIGNPTYLKSLYNTLGNAHYHLDNYDSAYYYYQEARYIFEDERDTFGLAAVYNNLGNVLFAEDLNGQAIEAYKFSIHNYHLSNVPSETVVPLYNIGSAFEWQENYDSAFIYYKKALHVVQTEGNMEYADAIYLELARSYAELGEADSSTAMFEKYIAYRDTVFEQNKNEAILKYETQFKTQETEKKLLNTKLVSAKREIYNFVDPA